ncbi:DUF2326 domain-containing protein [Photorhabdus tasmaniensis]|uniref:DUF2326 domain-containing protein n=1 Tax=Photorhabdus tasmaniensis TaxID=1004159 RepID=UPI0040420F15
MFLKSLQISNSEGIIRHIPFHAGLNLIVDETLSGPEQTTGNNVGKTTVLMLIDFCLGANGKGIYTDPENRKSEYVLVKNFLINTAVLVTLTLTADLDNPFAEELVIERNFLPRKQIIRRINGHQKTADEFEAALSEQLFPGHFGKKPTFAQIISHNIRYKELSITNTLRTLSEFTRDDEYETLYLFLLGCSFDQGDTKQNLLASIRMEMSFKSRLESKQTRSAYEASMALLSTEIDKLNEKKSAFYINPNFESDLETLDEIKYRINVSSSAISRLKLRRNLIDEAIRDIASSHTEIDTNQLKALYGEVTERLSNIQKSFEDLLEFHNRMVDEKVRYIAKEIPALEQELIVRENELTSLLNEEQALVAKISKSGSLEELESLIIELNEKHRRMGEFETIIEQILTVDTTLRNLNKSLNEIDEKLFSVDFEAAIQMRLNKLNKYFSSISQELYGEQYALKVDQTTTRTGQRIYKFSSFNTNFSSGKKQGEITCFDIAYTLFADKEGIPCYHFLLNDKKELMHDNQLTKIAMLVEREHKHVQYVASILKDKLPPELNQEKYFTLRLSQDDKLFRIESNN